MPTERRRSAHPSRRTRGPEPPLEDFIQMKKIFAIAASALVLAAPAISAQEEGPSAEAVIAYTAINSSTVGAIPLATNTLAPAGGMSWHLQYGRLSWGEDVSQSTYAGGINVGLGQGRLGISAGY